MQAQQPRASARPIVSRFNPFARLPASGGENGTPRSSGIIRLLPALARPLLRPGSSAPGPLLGRLGALEIRLATTSREVRQAQRLRYEVFYEEMSAAPSAAQRFTRRDSDAFDAICDHILVLDCAADDALRRGTPKPVGAYRLLRQDVAERHSGFYTAGEFAIAPLIDANRGLRFLELGRSCVLKPWRNRRTIELLWHGVWTYVLHHRIDAMIGCASFEGVEPSTLAQPLSFLHHYARAPEAWRVEPVAGRGVAMDQLPKEAVDVKAAGQMLPPLIKGYLRLGAVIGDGAVIDWRFGATDVAVVLPVSAISRRYVDHFGPAAERHAA